MARLSNYSVSLCVAVVAPYVLLACSTPAADGEAGDTSGPGSTETSATETGATETGATETGETETDPPRPARLAVTADWRAKRLSLLDYGALRDGATSRDAALWKTIELPDHEPGPLEVELSPDGRLAVVAVAPGFFAGAGGALVGLASGDVPPGGALLIVDIDAGMVLAELTLAHYPMGIAITPDGTTAFTANYGGNGQSGTTLSTIDLVNFAVTSEIEVGPGPEQLHLSADGSLAIINTAGDGSIRLFETANPSASLSPPLMVSADSSWVLLLDDPSSRAVAINSLGPPGYSLLDVSDPAAPSVIETISITGVAYAGALGAASNEILLSIYTGLAISLQLYDVDAGEIIEQIDVPVTGLPLGVVFEPSDELALVPVPGSNVLIVADFATGEHRVLDWQAEVGPTYVTLE